MPWHHLLHRHPSNGNLKQKKVVSLKLSNPISHAQRKQSIRLSEVAQHSLTARYISKQGCRCSWRCSHLRESQSL